MAAAPASTGRRRRRPVEAEEAAAAGEASGAAGSRRRRKAVQAAAPAPEEAPAVRPARRRSAPASGPSEPAPDGAARPGRRRRQVSAAETEAAAAGEPAASAGPKAAPSRPASRGRGRRRQPAEAPSQDGAPAAGAVEAVPAAGGGQAGAEPPVPEPPGGTAAAEGLGTVEAAPAEEAIRPRRRRGRRGGRRHRRRRPRPAEPAAAAAEPPAGTGGEGEAGPPAEVPAAETAPAATGEAPRPARRRRRRRRAAAPEERSDPGAAAAPEQPPSPLEELARELGVEMREARWYRQALYHASYVNERGLKGVSSNERLEFLGDAVLDLAVAHYLFERYPELPEGELSRLRAAVVRASTLAARCRALGIWRFALLGKGEERSGGRKRMNFLADLYEAMVGAIFLDQGIAAATEFVLRTLQPDLEAAAEGLAHANYKAQLQDQVQRAGAAPITYGVVSVEGPPHARIWQCEVRVGGRRAGIGRGRTKRAAEQEAAREALLRGWSHLDEA